MTIKPLADRIVIKMTEAEETTKERSYTGGRFKGKASGCRGCCCRSGRSR